MLVLISVRTGVTTIAVTFIAAAPSANSAVDNKSADAAITAVTARLTAQAVVPRPSAVPAKAKGAFSARVRPGRTGTWYLSYSSVGSRVVEAHIHLGPRGKRGTLALILCRRSSCRPNMHGESARIAADTSLWQAMVDGRAYVDVHTERNPRGALRGQTESVQTTG